MAKNQPAPLAFLEDAPALPSGHPGWISELREQGRAAYDAAGLPGRRTESWKYTRVSDLPKAGFLAADEETPIGVLPEGVADVDGWRLVLVNGRLVPALSDLDGLPAGVRVASLRQDLDRDPAWVEARLGKLMPLTDMPLAAVNTALLGDGVVVHISPDVVVDRPIHVVSVGHAPERPIAFHPRCLIVVERNARAVVVESHAGSGRYLANGVSEVFVAAGGNLGHYKLQNEGREAIHLAATAVETAESAAYDSFTLQIGGKLARNEIIGRLTASGIDFRLNGAYAGSEGQHIDNTTFIDHMAPDSNSREIYKGVLADTARGVFQGKILVRQDAQRTDGHQLSRALLLSRGAEIDTKPELEIYADDVKCSHGATAGELDAAQLFYLRARGIDETTARAVLIEAFLTEVLEEIRSDNVRSAFADRLRGPLRRMAGSPELGVEDEYDG